MRSFLILFLLASTPAFAENICVQTFNVYGPAYAPNRVERTDGLLDYLITEGCTDAVQLQEVWVESHEKQIAHGLDVALQKLNRVRADELRKDGDKTGLLEFFKGNVLESGSQKFLKNKSGFFDWIRGLFNVEKGFSYSLVQFHETKVLFINVHTHPQSTEIRLAQIKQIGDWLKGSKLNSYPIVMTGDFNAEPDTAEWKYITTTMGMRDLRKELSEKDTCTYCSSTNPLAKTFGIEAWLDYIFVRDSKDQRVEAYSYKVTPKEHHGLFLSDHYGLKAELQISPLQ